tara:strand:+ start:1147 stop:1371 length:225 start_codon:yes stop_codon:yes gene_type:complete
MINKTYEKPIAFDVDQPVTGVRRYTIFAHSEEEAIEKAENNNLTEHDAVWFDELESHEFYVVDADESATLEVTN